MRSVTLIYGQGINEKSVNMIDNGDLFILVFRKNPFVRETLLTGDVALLSKSNFNASNPTKVFIHGWNMNGHNHTTLINLKNGKFWAQRLKFESSKCSPILILKNSLIKKIAISLLWTGKR